jgi:hypothetical protein
MNYIGFFRPAMVAVETLHSSGYYWRWTNCPCIQDSVLFLQILLLISNCAEDGFRLKSGLLSVSKVQGWMFKRDGIYTPSSVLPIVNSRGIFSNLLIWQHLCYDYWRIENDMFITSSIVYRMYCISNV